MVSFGAGKEGSRRAERSTQGTLSRGEGSNEDGRHGNRGKKGWDGVVGSEIR